MLVCDGGKCGYGELWCEYIGGTRHSDILSSAYDVLEMSGVRGGVCEMCMSLAWGGVR